MTQQEDLLWPLPIRLRPRAGETAEAYVHRLAKANHLRPSYLRRLTAPSWSFGPIQPSKLAVLADRALPALLHAFPDLATPTHRRNHNAREANAERKRQNQARKRALFAAIRHDHHTGMSARAIERKHKVGWRTIRNALNSPTPPARRPYNRQPTALHGLQQHIDQLLEANRAATATEVWEQLYNDHATTISYGTVRTYIRTRSHTSTSKIH